MTAPGRAGAADDQAGISDEMERRVGTEEVGRVAPVPDLDYPPYRSSVRRHPTTGVVVLEPGRLERHSPVFGHSEVDEVESDLTVRHRGEPIGERMTVTGRVTDSGGRPVAHQLVEIWQANAAGRYFHRSDQHSAPIDPNFTGTGRCVTDADGHYSFVTIKPGPYPWTNHRNAWRPAHIHFSLFGTRLTQRLVTQMYFPGDPLLDLDPIWRSITDPPARQRLVASYDHSVTRPGWSTGYRWDIVLSGDRRTWAEPAS